MKTILLLITIIYIIMMSTLNAQWIKQSVPGNAGIMLSIDFANINTGVSCGNRSLFYGKAIYTSNGGANWYYASVPDSSRSFVSVDMADSLTGYMGGAYNLQTACESYSSDYQFLLQKGYSVSSAGYMELIGMRSRVDYRGLFVKTTDGGRNWFTLGVLPTEVSYLIGIDFINANTGVITTSIQDSTFSTHSTVLKTSNGGITWNEILVVDSVLELRAIELIDGNNIIAVGRGGRSDSLGHSTIGGMVFKSTDGGQSWSLFHALHEDFTDVIFTDLSNGYVTSNSNGVAKIYKTTNQGNNWNAVYSYGDIGIYGISFYSGSGTGMIYGEAWLPLMTGYAIRTIDYGITWGELQYVDTTRQNLLYGGAMPGEFNNYICGGDPFGECVIYHTTNGGVMLLENSGSPIPQRFSLAQNYPNPFNPKTIFSYELRVTGYVVLKVYDALGKVVATLVNEKQSAGTYQVEFDGSGLANGVYFYRIEAGEFTETKRMVLLK